MIAEAIYEEKKWTKGSSRQAIAKFIVANYDVDPEIVNTHITKALRSLVEEDKLVKNKGSFKLSPKFKNSFKKDTGKATPKKKKGGSKKKTTKRKVTKKGRKKKDKDAPKRPTSAWIYFSVKKREELKKKNPDLSFGQLSKMAGKEWKKISDAKKAKYEELAAEDKKRYEKESKAYEKKKKESSSSSEESSSSASSSSEEKGKKKGGSKED